MECGLRPLAALKEVGLLVSLAYFIGSGKSFDEARGWFVALLLLPP